MIELAIVVYLWTNQTIDSMTLFSFSAKVHNCPPFFFLVKILLLDTQMQFRLDNRIA